MPPKTSSKSKPFEYNPSLDLKPGRHPCDCQARVHELVRNCLRCGRIVCRQEGSGPCFFCQTLVCTADERALIESGTKRGNELLEKLMGGSTGTGKGPSLKDAAGNIDLALAYRNKLLIADADSERRNKVNDLQSDYLNLESNPYLTRSEREAILERKAQLRQMKMERNKHFVVSFDFESGSVRQEKENALEIASDPVLQSILHESQQRMREEQSRKQTEPTSEARLQCDDFTPKYEFGANRNSAATSTKNRALPRNIDGLFGDEDFDEAYFDDIAKKGYCLALSQPLASLVVAGLRQHIPSVYDVKITGPVLVASNTESVNAQKAKVNEQRAVTRASASKGIPIPKEIPLGAILGRVVVEECLTVEEYAAEYGSEAECSLKHGYILIVSHAKPLPASIPYIPPVHELHQVNQNLIKTVNNLLGSYSV
uniref:Zf-C2HC5 domain-containing protein n=1 Tax=Panagrellus redivivus TaxID=6233 RepID=A0A7E4VQT6_PANRE